MIRIPNRIIETYAYKDFIVEICKEECQGFESYCAYLHREDYGVKDYMFGVDVNGHTLEEFIELVEANLEDYIMGYEEAYCE